MPVESVAAFLAADGTQTAAALGSGLPCAADNVQNQTLQASGAQTATGNGTAVTGFGQYKVLMCELDVTAAATEVGDELDVFVQTQVDGTNWVDVVHFTQVLGNGGAKRYFAKINAGIAQAEFENGAALGAAAVRNILGDTYRVRWAITDAGDDNASFTFSVKANGIS
jgi:hypothetical protein